MPEPVARAVAGLGGQCADDAVAEPGLATEHAGDLVDVTFGAGDHDAELQGAEPAGAVHAAAQQEPAEHQHGETDAEGQHVDVEELAHLRR